MCSSRKYPDPYIEAVGNSGGMGGSMAQEILKERGALRPNSLPDGLEDE